MNTKVTSRILIMFFIVISLLNNAKGDWANYGNVQINNAVGSTIYVYGDISNNGTTPIIANNYHIYLTGNLINNNAVVMNLGTGTFTFNGTTASQKITGPFTFGNLTVSNSAGVELDSTTASSITVTDTLMLNKGILTTNNTNTLLLLSNGIALGASTSSYVIGNFVKSYSTGGGISFSYPLGTADGYSPVTLAFNTITTAGSVTGTVKHQKQPEAGIKSLSRYWTLTKDNNVVFNSYAGTFQYLPQDFNVTSLPSDTDMIWGQYTGTWIWYQKPSSQSLLSQNGDKFGTITISSNTASFGDFTGVKSNVGINTLTENKLFNLYPNPNNGNFAIQICGFAGETYTVEIWSSLGMKVFEQKIIASNTDYIQNLNVAKLETGIYSLKLINTHTGFIRSFIVSK